MSRKLSELSFEINYNDKLAEKAINIIMYLVEKARREGFLSLTDDVNTLLERKDINDFQRLLTNSLLTIIDGWEPEEVEDLMCIILLRERNKRTNMINLMSLTIAEGLLCLQRGSYPRLVLAKLNALLGKNLRYEDFSGEREWPTIPIKKS